MTASRIRALVLPLVGAVVVLVVALLVRTGAPTASSKGPAAGAAATAGSPAPAPVASGHVTVAIANYAYAPARLTVRVGTMVTWTNHDATAHTATANDNTSFDTGTINPHHSGTVHFTKPGTYPYHCSFHAFMTGTVTVVR